ncbi:DUF6 domain protein, putative [Paecilomyces variotii No. 5]|uniref:DUF6 domain protein, putative n=1 Tax=Byssochlamys spectabilis (strain No. 5 / NBRC 109023) TaxID=1356009 RepID=V5FDG7_BYSSN|nr:DUF6 domain protein, putative [Paecilomyces variotii No. 5]
MAAQPSSSELTGQAPDSSQGHQGIAGIPPQPSGIMASIEDENDDKHKDYPKISRSGIAEDRPSNKRDDVQHLGVPLANSFRPSTDSLYSDLSVYSGRMVDEPPSEVPLLRSPSPTGSQFEAGYVARPTTWKGTLWTSWLQSKGMIMVMLSQFFGASMNVMTRLLEMDGAHGKGMDPFQILFARMSITAIASYAYMWYAKVPHPFGTREVRWLLVLRAFGGFFGVFGIYYAMLYMPLSEATVLTFLAPIVACYACSFLMPNEPFTRKQQLAGIVSLLGVVLIAQPFGQGSASPGVDPDNGDKSGDTEESQPVDMYHHMLAVLVSLVGVLGAACAYTTIRWIGTRAHALVSVTYFSTWTTIVSVVAILALPSSNFRLPANMTEWTLLLGLGVAGFVLQFLLTAGLAYVPPPKPGQSSRAHGSSGHGSRATSMVYTQMLFALFYDKVIWNSTPSAASWAGSGLILGSAIYVAVARENNRKLDVEPTENNRAGVAKNSADEEAGDLETGTALLREGVESVQPDIRQR